MTSFMHKEETWKPMLGAETIYAVSDLGRVKRLKFASGTRVGRICKPSYVRGYARYALCIGGERPRMISAHRLVYEAFVGKIPEGMQINHKNGIKDDNRPENLEVMTPAENTQHAYRVLGLPGRKNPQPGETNGRAKVNWDMVRDIRRLYGSGGYSQQALASLFGLDQTNVSRIIRGDTWKQV